MQLILNFAATLPKLLPEFEEVDLDFFEETNFDMAPPQDFFEEDYGDVEIIEEIFDETQTYDYEIVAERLRQTAFLNKGLKIILTDNRVKPPTKRDCQSI